ncbi:MAG: histidine ammonia-lyase [candidate division KSB1 bacterium]|nr:histidine ammonia-lyase [candidate division KSB1 bacterium]MDZ7303634.1 histidine ammonia-lyase [candidate division KSB1 bacterium]MDZ7312871.1 histidine ammonia-lyase [candidate division KSB1 bacterium]
MILRLDGISLTLEKLDQIAHGKVEVQLASEALERMVRSRKVVEEVLRAGCVIYGVNTGFGKLSDVRIPPDDLKALQKNLILSHACGTGPALSAPEVRSLLALKINALLSGYSGVRPVIAEYLLRLLQNEVLPVIPEKGSVGASGDLAPLAHMALVLLGEGEAEIKGQRMSGAKALRYMDLPPLQLEAKEGLALLNGTQFMTAVGALALLQAETLARSADVVGAMSAEALLCTPVAFDARIQVARGYAGQQQSAANLRRLMANSPIRDSHLHCSRVQDAYSVRCMPQVHGAVRDQLRCLREIFTIELNAATDNPLVFVEDRSVSAKPSPHGGEFGQVGEILSGGNFHGHPISTACDFLAILVTHLANISERRIAALMDPAVSELPAFLVKHSGLNSGFMITQVAAASLVAENKILSHPLSVDSIPTSANKEDYVSMGAGAAIKARNAVRNATQVLAIELLAACQALDLRAPLLPGPATGAVRNLVRQVVPTLVNDRILANDMAIASQLIASGDIVHVAESVVGEL